MEKVYKVKVTYVDNKVSYIEWRDFYSDLLLLHREDGPAVEYTDGFKAWYKNGARHRENGPAIEGYDGSKYWLINGKAHREDGPADRKSTRLNSSHS